MKSKIRKYLKLKYSIMSKRLILISATVLCMSMTDFSQNPKYEYRGRFTPSIKKEKLKEAIFINEIMPEFSRYFLLPYEERIRFDELLKLVDSPRRYYVYPQESFYPQKNYEKIMDYVSIEISAVCQGKAFTSQSTGSALTMKQKDILNAADLGTDLGITIKFKYKNWANDNLDGRSELKKAEYIVTVVPETEAGYPGGYKQITEYLKKNVIDKISEAGASEKIRRAILKFRVNEEGQIMEAKISRTSTDPKIDKLILDAAHKMPKWNPAKDSKGIKVKEEFSIVFGGGC
jgi:hypothetical protein